MDEKSRRVDRHGITQVVSLVQTLNPNDRSVTRRRFLLKNTFRGCFWETTGTEGPVTSRRGKSHKFTVKKQKVCLHKESGTTFRKNKKEKKVQLYRLQSSSRTSLEGKGPGHKRLQPTPAEVSGRV